MRSSFILLNAEHNLARTRTYKAHVYIPQNKFNTLEFVAVTKLNGTEQNSVWLAKEFNSNWKKFYLLLFSGGDFSLFFLCSLWWNFWNDVKI